jgi:hypothetical protein
MRCRSSSAHEGGGAVRVATVTSSGSSAAGGGDGEYQREEDHAHEFATHCQHTDAERLPTSSSCRDSLLLLEELKTIMREQIQAIYSPASFRHASQRKSATPTGRRPGAQASKFYEELIKTPLVPHRSQEEILKDKPRGGGAQADKAIAASEARVKEAEDG